MVFSYQTVQPGGGFRNIDRTSTDGTNGTSRWVFGKLIDENFPMPTPTPTTTATPTPTPTPTPTATPTLCIPSVPSVTCSPGAPVQFIGSAANITGSVTFPPHQEGDLIVFYGDNLQYFAPVLPSNSGWRLLFSSDGGGGNGGGRVFMTKIASCSAEPYPTFSGAQPVHTVAAVYRCLENTTQIPNPTNGTIVAGATGNTVPNIWYTTINSNTVVPGRENFIITILRGTTPNPPVSLQPMETPRTGFVQRIASYSGSVTVPSQSVIIIHDSNGSVTTEIPQQFLPINPARYSYTSYKFLGY